MSEISLRQSILKSHLPWHGARLNFLAQLLIALFRVKTVNLAEIAPAFVGRAQQASHYKRLQRFFRHFELDDTVVARAVVALMSFSSQWVVCFERTQSQFGQTTHNVLMLAVAHQGVAFPLLWVLLPKRGNSNTAERIDLVARLLQLFAIACERPEDYGRPISRWMVRELADQVSKQGIVEHISARQVGRLMNEADLKPHQSQYWLNPPPTRNSTKRSKTSVRST